MRYLVLLFFAALVMLNEPIASASERGQPAVGDQADSIAASPAAVPVADMLSLVTPAGEVSIAIAQLSSSIEVSPGVPRHVWYQDAASSQSQLTNYYGMSLAAIQEGMRLLCFNPAISYRSTAIATYHQASYSPNYSSRGQTNPRRSSTEAGPRRLL